MNRYVLLDEEGKVKTYPYSIWDLRADHPNTSFPNEISLESLKEFNVEPVVLTSSPEGLDFDETLFEDVQKKDDGTWVQTWTIVQATPAQVEERLKQEAVRVRCVRDDFLKSSDWSQLADAPVDSVAWAAYRQALRDIPKQDGFPGNVTWPTIP